jgi:O-antigen/teichoic acid export membrane protein
MSSAALSTAGVLVQGLSRFAVTALIGRVMGPSDLAHVSAWLSLALILSLLWPTGAGNAASHFLARARARGENPVRALQILTRSFWISCVAMVAIGVPVAVIGLGADAADAVAVAAVIVTYSGYIFTRGVQVGLGRLVDTAIWDFVSAAVTTVLLVAVLALQASPLLLWPIAIGYAVFCARVLATGHRGHAAPVVAVPEADAPLDTSVIWHVIRWNSLGVLASNGLIQFSMLFVFAVVPRTPAGLTEAGLYAAAMSLATPASMLSQAITQVLLARFSEWAATDAASARRKFIGVLAVMAGFLALVFAVVALLSHFVLVLIYGDAYAGATATMQLLLAAVFAFSISLVANAYLITTGQTALATIASLAGLLGGLAVMFGTLAAGWQVSIAGSAGVLVGYTIALVITVTLSVLPHGRAPRAKWLTAPAS